MKSQKVDLHEDGILISIKIRKWDARKSQNVKQLGKDIPAEIIRASKSLIDDRTVLKDFSRLGREAKHFIKMNSAPFPVDSVFWIPKERVIAIDEKLIDIEQRFTVLKNELAKNIGKFQKRYAKKYPAFYDPEKYPSPEEIKAKFNIKWRFFDMTLPTTKKGLSVKMLRREEEKAKQMVKEIEEMTLNMFGNAIIRRLAKLNTQCSDGRANQGTLNSINKLLKNWEDLWGNHVDDNSFRMAINRIKKQMKKTDAVRLRDNDDFRNKVEKETKKIIGKIKNVPNFQLNRKISL